MQSRQHVRDHAVHDGEQPRMRTRYTLCAGDHLPVGAADACRRPAVCRVWHVYVGGGVRENTVHHAGEHRVFKACLEVLRPIHACHIIQAEGATTWPVALSF